MMRPQTVEWTPELSKIIASNAGLLEAQIYGRRLATRYSMIHEHLQYGTWELNYTGPKNDSSFGIARIKKIRSLHVEKSKAVSLGEKDIGAFAAFHDLVPR